MDQDTAPGWRGRIGVIQPAPGLMLEHEWAAAMPAGVAWPVTRLPLQGGTPADYTAMAARAPEAAATLANAGAGLVAYACGVGSVHEGPAAEAALMRRLSEAAGGIPAIGMGQAAVAAMQHLGAAQVSLLTPYPASVNALIEDYLRAAGLTPAGCFGLPIASAVAAAGLQAAQIAQAAEQAIAASRPDLLWLPCTNVRSLALIAGIEAATGCAVISSTQALLWTALRKLGVPVAAAGRGRLFAG